MKNLFFIILAIMMLSITSCEAIGDIFSAGFYSGLALVVAVVVLIVWLAGKKRG
jgi:TRAP-type C4-dicarboxylate transport system permease large subunit